MPLVTVTVDGAVRRSLSIVRGRVVRDEFNEEDHPRAANGQFGSNGMMHVLTTKPDGGEGEVRAVTDDEDAAAEEHDRILYADEDQEGDADSVEMHSVPLDRRHDGPVSAVHVLHSVDYSGDGVVVHGAYDDADAARGHAVLKSKEAWADFGPERGDIDRDEKEEDEAAQAWNAAAGGGGLRIKANAYGQAGRTPAGDLRWERDGDEVDPDEEDGDPVGDFDEHFDRMFPADGRAAYPGFDAANDHFEVEDDLANVFRIHRHGVA